MGLYSYETLQLWDYIATVGLYSSGTTQLWDYKAGDLRVVGLYSCGTIKLGTIELWI